MTNQQDTALLPVTEEALKPCPFCEGVARVVEDSDRKYPWAVRSFHQADCFLMHSNINRHRSYETEAEAIAAWNTRAEQPKPSGEADEATAVARIHGGFAVGEKNGQRRYVLLGNDGKFYSAESLNGPWQEWPPATGDDSK